MNTIVAIGCMSDYTCYLNVPEEEAKARYLKANGSEGDTFESLSVNIRTIEIDDQFGAYEIWG